MLLTKNVEVGVSSGNYKHYEKLGYEIPKHYDSGHKKWKFIRGAKICVKVEDLMISSVKVRVKCDICGEEKEVIYQGYLNNKHKDKDYCAACAAKVFNSGENSFRWNPNMTDEERMIVNSKSRRKHVDGYSSFMQAVMKRDKYCCVVCGKRAKELHVHHLNGFSYDKENRTNPENAVTLCKKCHDEFHSIYGKENNTKEQFEKYDGNIIDNTTYIYGLSPLKKVVFLNTGEIYNTLKDCATDLGVDVKRIYDVCTHKKYSVNDYHFMYLEEYEQTPKNMIKYAHTYQGHNSYGEGCSKKVKCITTGEIFDCISDASEKYLKSRKNDGRIAMCCNGKRHYVGKLEDGTKLVWEWYDQ